MYFLFTAALRALERHYPQIYASNDKLKIDINTVSVQRQDFAKCLRSIVPASHRVKATFDIPLPKHMEPLLKDKFEAVLRYLATEFPVTNVHKREGERGHGNEVSLATGAHTLLQLFRPRLLLASDGPNGTL
jgi:cytolysin (calcineurin-like family phosphatase)